MHAKMGNAAQMEAFGRRVIRSFMPDQHRVFYGQLPFLVVGAVDAQGDPWAGVIEGSPGFVDSPDPRTLTIHQPPAKGDPLLNCLQQPNAAVGLLGIELHTRRRNRMNGNVAAISPTAWSVTVGQAFGNCPQYIQDRAFSFACEPGQPYEGQVETMVALDAAAAKTIALADTFFVASAHPGDAANPGMSVDVSHRGGKPGFVRRDGDVLTIPDFAGNLHFNTLGNLLINPKAGLVFVDFETGDLLQLTGSTELVLDGAEIATFQGAERLWRFRVARVVRRRGVLALRWRLRGFSPNSLMTGSWADAAARQAANAQRDAWRPFEIERIVDESRVVRSFYLKPTDGLGLPSFDAGQHLPIQLQAAQGGKALLRTYTLCAAPSDGFYRISVKRAGQASRLLHDHYQFGDTLLVRAPQGQFGVDALARRPAVLLAGGIGITPLLAMLRHIVFEGIRTRRVRPTYLFYATRTKAERGFDAELDQLLRRAGNSVKLVRVLSQPEPDAQIGRDFEVAGRIDMALLKAALPFDDFDFYLCGPGPFMQDVYDGLRDMHISDARIHAEAFGPAGLKRRTAPSQSKELPPVATSEVKVLFAQSAKEARWTPSSGSLLDVAEDRGLTPPFSCRGGSCGTCRTAVLEGTVTYPAQPAFQLDDGEALLCCAVPAQTTDPAAKLVLAA